MKKYIVLCIFILVVFSAFAPYIKATETPNKGFDLAIIDIVPYIWKEEKGLLGELHLSPEIQNIGDTSTTDTVRYDGNSSYYITKSNYSRAWGALLIGSLEPGETWIPKSGAGLVFLNFIPRIFILEYEVTPLDSNPDNNYIRQVYFITGGGLVKLCMSLPFLK
jgi:hypothetical protein